MSLPPPAWEPPRDPEARTFLDELDFERFIPGRGSAEESGPQAGTLEMRQFHTLHPGYVEDVSDLLAERVPGTSLDVSHLFQLCLNELLQNAFEHAHSKLGCFVVARWFAATRNARIAVVDGGIGIPAALRREYVSELHRGTDLEAVVAAVTQKGLTSRRDGRYGGYGLKHLHSLVTQRGGKLTVISHKAKVVFKTTGIAQTSTSYLRGTAVEVDFRPLRKVRSDDVLEVF